MYMLYTLQVDIYIMYTCRGARFARASAPVPGAEVGGVILGHQKIWARPPTLAALATKLAKTTMSKRSAPSYPLSKKARKAGYSTVLGFARSQGGLTAQARAMQVDRVMPVPRPIRIEKKGVDIAVGYGPVINTTTTNAGVFVLNLIQQGAGSWNRVGRKVQLQSIRIKSSCLNDYTAQASTNNIPANFLRMVVIWDRQPSGATIPTWEQVFSHTAQDGTESSSVMAQLAYDNMDRFSVLRDKVITFSPAATNVTGGSANLVQQVVDFDEYIKLGGRETVFSGQSQPMTIADISTGGLYVYFRAKENIAATSLVYVNTPTWARLRYTDA